MPLLLLRLSIRFFALISMIVAAAADATCREYYGAPCHAYASLLIFSDAL